MNFKFDVFGFSETWLTEHSTLPHLPGYTPLCKNRTHKCGGGVSLFIRDALPYTQRNDIILSNEVCDSLFVEINNDVGKNVIVGIIYKPPNINPDVFTEALENILGSLNRENKNRFYNGRF